MTTINLPMRFGKGAGLMLSANEKAQPGPLALLNASLDQRGVIEKRPGGEALVVTTTDDPPVVIPAADRVAIHWREDELVLETCDALYSREQCDGAGMPAGGFDRRGPFTRTSLRIEQDRDWGDLSIVQSSAALVTAPNGASPCALHLVELRPEGGNPSTVKAIVFADDHDEHTESTAGSGQVVTVASPGAFPHVTRVGDTLLAMVWAEGGAELFYDFWTPGDIITSTPTGAFRGIACDVIDLTGVTVGGTGFYGLILVDVNKDIQIQIRDDTGSAVNETRTILGATSDPIAVAIYAIPDPVATEPTFIFAAVARGPANTRVHYVEVATFDGGALVPIWSSDGASRAEQGTPVRITVAALISSYTTIGRIAVQETTAAGDPYTTATDITSGGFVNPSEVLYKRNTIYSSMTEIDGQLVWGQTAVEFSQDPTKRSGLFLTAEPEVVASADFGATETLDQEAARSQVSDTNQLGSLLVVGYQVITGLLEPGPDDAEDGLTATRLMLLDRTPTNNKSAELQGVMLSAHAGYPRAYDGQDVFEQSPHELPHILTVAQDETPGGILAGNYGVAVTWEAYDARGSFYRTQPDFENVVIVGNNISIGVVFRTLQRTERPVVRAVIWRTLLNGGVYRKAASVDAKVATAPNDNIVVTLSEGDTDIADNELLDQVPGGTRPSQPTRITDWIASAGGRLWGPDPFRGSLVRFTIPISEGLAPHWPLVQGVEVEQSARVTAMGSMDGRFVFWTRSEAHSLAGAGPSATGQGLFGQPRLVPSSTGASAQPTVALTPDGLVFGSGFSPHILTRGLTTMEYADMVYRPYETDGEAVAAAIWRPIERTTTLVNGTAGKTLVFSPETVRWMEDSRQARDIAISSGRDVAWLLADGTVLVEPAVPANERIFTDGGEGYQFLVSTPWIHQPGVNALHSMFSLVRVQVWGDYLGPHELQVRVYYDYATTPAWSGVISAATTAANHAAGVPYYYELGVAEPCYAARVEFSDAAEPNRTFRLGGIDVVIEPQGSSTTPSLKESQGFRKVTP